MWVLTPFGFFSVVQKSFEPHGVLTIRARSRGDLENLRDQYLESKMSQIIEDVHADYQFRATVINKDWAEAVGQMSMDIDYDNFKNEVKARQGSERATIYSRVWSDLYEIQHPTPRREQITAQTDIDLAVDAAYFAPELAGVEQTDEWRSDEERDEQLAATEQILAPLHKEPVTAYDLAFAPELAGVDTCDFCGDVTTGIDRDGNDICQSCRQIPEQDREKMI